ncbi:MAG: hypothetical protein ACYS9T_02660 [Planctomycetota bacterium]
MKNAISWTILGGKFDYQIAIEKIEVGVAYFHGSGKRLIVDGEQGFPYMALKITVLMNQLKSGVNSNEATKY